MTIIRPMFIALDSSHLGNLAGDTGSGNEGRRKAAAVLLDCFSDSGCVLLLCWHHFEELLRHRDGAVVAERIAFFQSLGMVGWIASMTGDAAPGSIIDILAFEVSEAFKDAQADPVAIRDRVMPKFLRFGAGREAIGPIVEHLQELQEAFRRREERNREIVAIARSQTMGDENTKVMDWWKGRWRTTEDARGRLASMTQLLSEDIRQRGDKRIPDSATVTANFLAGVHSRAEAALGNGKEFSDDALLPEDVDRCDIGPSTTLGEMGDLGAFRSRLRLVNQIHDLPWPELKQRVRETRLPSGLIQSTLRRHTQDPPERKGSELIDRYLACLAPYADITFVDKRTHEAVERARRKSPQFAAVIRRIEKAGTYSDIARKLGETRR